MVGTRLKGNGCSWPLPYTGMDEAPFLLQLVESYGGAGFDTCTSLRNPGHSAEDGPGQALRLFLFVVHILNCLRRFRH